MTSLNGGSKQLTDALSKPVTSIWDLANNTNKKASETKETTIASATNQITTTPATKPTTKPSDLGLSWDPTTKPAATTSSSSSSSSKTDLRSTKGSLIDKIIADSKKPPATKPKPSSKLGFGWASKLGFAEGGMINEMIYGVGKPGKTYTLGEKGVEMIVPMDKFRRGGYTAMPNIPFARPPAPPSNKPLPDFGKFVSASHSGETSYLTYSARCSE